MTRAESTVRGLAPILATPFGPDGSLDLTSLRRLTEFQLGAGVDGVAVFGMASEGFALTAGERRQILITVSDIVAGAVPIIAGISGTSTVTAIEQVHEIGDVAAALMVLPPFMVKPTPTQLVDFYAAVAAAGAEHGAEVMVQDAPGATGVSMTASLIVQLAKLPGVTSVKIEAPPTAPKVGSVVDLLDGPSDDSGFVLLGGQNSQFALDEYARGAVGTMPACEFSDLLAPVLAGWTAGRTREARRDFARLLPLIVFGLQQGIAWSVHKHVLVARGVIDHATVRSPARDLEPAGRTSLMQILTDLDLGAAPRARP